MKSAKYHLQRIVGGSHLIFEELQTVLCEIEAVLNSRPSTPLSSDSNDLACFTPGHFLISGALNELQQRQKWANSKGEKIEIGWMMLIRQQGLPSLQWMLGRISEIHPGADGIARSATVITARGSIIRSLSKLSILPLKD